MHKRLQLERLSPELRARILSAPAEKQQHVMRQALEETRMKLEAQGKRRYAPAIVYPQHGIDSKTILEILNRWKRRKLLDAARRGELKAEDHEVMAYYQPLNTRTGKGHSIQDAEVTAAIIARRFILREVLHEKRLTKIPAPQAATLEKYVLGRVRTIANSGVALYPPKNAVLIKLINELGRERTLSALNSVSEATTRISQMAKELYNFKETQSDVFINATIKIISQIELAKMVAGNAKLLAQNAGQEIERLNTTIQELKAFDAHHNHRLQKPADYETNPKYAKLSTVIRQLERERNDYALQVRTFAKNN